MSDFREIKKVKVSMAQMAAAYRHFRAMGNRGLEGVALWVGQFAGNEFLVTETVIPRQKGYSSGHGLLYVVGEEELRRLNVWLYEKHLRLVAQLHSHPAAAYHSDTDDEFPIMTTLGGFSIVVPDFGAGAPLLRNCATFRLGDHSWQELTVAQVVDIFEVS